MSKRYKKTTTLADTMAKRSRMSLDLLIALAHALAANEKTQRRFRNAVLMRLSNIETIVERIHGAQIVEGQLNKSGCEEKVRRMAKAAEEWISQTSKKRGLAMVKYIYGDSEETVVPRDRRRKWAEWDI